MLNIFLFFCMKHLRIFLALMAECMSLNFVWRLKGQKCHNSKDKQFLLRKYSEFITRSFGNKCVFFALFATHFVFYGWEHVYMFMDFIYILPKKMQKQLTKFCSPLKVSTPESSLKCWQQKMVLISYTDINKQQHNASA